MRILIQDERLTQMLQNQPLDMTVENCYLLIEGRVPACRTKIFVENMRDKSGPTVLSEVTIVEDSTGRAWDIQVVGDPEKRVELLNTFLRKKENKSSIRGIFKVELRPEGYAIDASSIKL